ncbi:hypothetical protein PSTG_07493 [Puccinia striiformis f. sp. tritici PST-78]|uniref:Uncharacterized protein n=1 Tax=Puccinia striiformis f. sp. tritici PST-78 TaxID=1165861 RepID=A0A0L0VJK4_9BASI|nr:hypothetical protein PSTG_07493 [Puccinia striiformis f. sp. tritici PST-78]
MKSFSGLTLLSIFVASSSSTVIPNGGSPHFNTLIARHRSAGRLNKLVARQDQGGNLQTFGGTLGAAAPTVTKQGGVFVVQFGPPEEKFRDSKAAIIRSCDRQSNRCADFFNRGRRPEWSESEWSRSEWPRSK